MENKLFTVCFTRGSGKCRDEVTYVILDTDMENVKKRVQEFFAKYFSGKDWLVGIYDFDDTGSSSKDGFYCVAEYYS